MALDSVASVDLEQLASDLVSIVVVHSLEAMEFNSIILQDGTSNTCTCMNLHQLNLNITNVTSVQQRHPLMLLSNVARKIMHMGQTLN